MLARRDAYTVLVGKPDGKMQLRYLSIDGRVILQWRFKK